MVPEEWKLSGVLLAATEELLETVDRAELEGVKELDVLE